MKPGPHIDIARALLDYDAGTGVIVWRVDRNWRIAAGTRAGCQCGDGYRTIRVDGTIYPEHRLAWLLHYGVWPEAFIDHINGDRSDNRIVNLRAATLTQNNRNRRVSGRWGKGVGANGRRFFASITVDRKDHYLGTFDTPEEAHEAYCVAAYKYHGEFARTE